MDSWTIFAILQSIFSDKPSTGCDSIGLCTCVNNPATQLKCPPDKVQNELPSFSSVNSRFLTQIDLSGVPIKTLSDSKPFQGARISTKGVKVYLSDTQLTTFDSSFFEGISKTIETLDLKNNYIKHLNTLRNFYRLELVYLQNNKFTSFPSTLCEAPRLRYVNLRYNPIRTDWSNQVNSLIKCNNLKKVYTDSNTMSCSCEKLKHYFYYHDHGLPLYVDEGGDPLTCSSDSAFGLAGRPVTSLRQQQVCDVCKCAPGYSDFTKPSVSILLFCLAVTFYYIF